MEKTGLVYSIITATSSIDSGRKGFATRGKAEEGRIAYEDGIAEAMSTFKEAQATADPYIMILAEYTFLTQELQFCDKSDTDSISSLTQAIEFFDDAFLVLKIIEDKNKYQAVEQSIPHNKKYRVKGFPKDSFHIACDSHKTRLKNILRSPGIDTIEKALLKQRSKNLNAAQNDYVEKQSKALAKE